MKNKKYSKGVFLSLPRYEKNLKEEIKFINSLPGINHVEVWIEENLNSSELKILKSSLKEYKILIHAPWVHLSLISPHPEIREITVKLYLQTLKIADSLKAKLVTFHCGGKTVFESTRETEKIFIQNFKKIRNNYKGKVPFTIENVPALLRGPQLSYPGFSDLIALKKKLPWLKLTLDTGHAFQEGRNLNSIAEFLERYKNSVLDIHLHDAILKGEAHLALGKGSLDFNKFFRILDKVGYAGYISLETISREDTRKSWQKIRDY